MPPPLFEVDGLRIAIYDQDVAATHKGELSGLLDRRGQPLPAGWVEAVPPISYSVEAGEVLGIVGESASGKSLALMGAFGLLSPGARVVGGRSLYEGRDMTKLPELKPKRRNKRRRERMLEELDDPEWRRILGTEIGFLFQDPIASWDPVFLIGEQAGEVLEEHTGLTQDEINDRVLDALGEVRLPKQSKFLSFSFELSRGEAQRAMLAAALIKAPRLLIADEPLSGLDPPVAAAILDLIRDMLKRRGMAMILVTHDLATVAAIADDVAVMYAGRIVEVGPVRQIFHHPKHPYTEGLLHSIPWAGAGRLDPIPGDAPHLTQVPRGCPFAERCAYAEHRCVRETPQLEDIGFSQAACLRKFELDLGGIRS